MALPNIQSVMPEITRKPLLTAAVNRPVAQVDVREITFFPGQQIGRHLHPCPVLGYIAEGEAVLEIEGQPPQPLPTGSVFYEPADTIIARFDNASDRQPLKFVAYYLRQGSEELIEMLPKVV